jgi:hypothetical protein
MLLEVDLLDVNYSTTTESFSLLCSSPFLLFVLPLAKDTLSWIVPPISGSTTPVFHTPYDNSILTPNLFYQDEPWREQKQFRCPVY